LVFVTDIILIVIKNVVIHKNLSGRVPVTIGALDGNAASVVWRPKGVVVDDILVDGDVIPKKCYSCPRTIRDGVVPYYDMVNIAATADAVSVCGTITLWRRLRLTDRNALSVAEDGETVDNDIRRDPRSNSRVGCHPRRCRPLRSWDADPDRPDK